MGYYTRYTLKTEPESAHDTIVLRCTELAYPAPHGAQPAHSVFDYESWNGGDGPKWYSHDKDCLQVSQEYPDVLIAVTGLGEDDGDHWIATYKAGKCLEWRKMPDV
jgi:hypothetical protein